MKKPSYSEINEFKNYLVSHGYETDRDRTRFTRKGDGVTLELWISGCTDGSFKALNARITLNFMNSWHNTGSFYTHVDFLPCKALSHSYVVMCELEHRKVELDVESFFSHTRNMVIERDKEVKEINKAALEAK